MAEKVAVLYQIADDEVRKGEAPVMAHWIASVLQSLVRPGADWTTLDLRVFRDVTDGKRDDDLTIRASLVVFDETA